MPTPSQRPMVDPNLPPQPVPPPAALPTKQKLSATELGRLPKPMSMQDRVNRFRKGPETPPSLVATNDDDDIAADDNDDSSSKTPLWEPSNEERSIIWPNKAPSTFDNTFNIDTTKSFLDSSKPAGKEVSFLSLLNVGCGF